MFAVGKRRREKAGGVTEQASCDRASRQLNPLWLHPERGTNKRLPHGEGRADFGFYLLAIKVGASANLCK